MLKSTEQTQVIVLTSNCVRSLIKYEDKDSHMKWMTL